MLSARISLAQPDFQLVGHCDAHFAPPRCFPWRLRASRCCQALPATPLPGFLPCPWVLSLTAPREQTPEPRCCPRAKRPPLVFSGSPMTRVTFTPTAGFTGRLPVPCPFHLIPMVIPAGCWPTSICGARRQLLPPSAGLVGDQTFLSVWFWAQFLLCVSLFLSNFSTDALSLKSHLCRFGFHWKVSYFMITNYNHQLELFGFIICSRTYPHICYSQLNNTFYKIANAKII